MRVQRRYRVYCDKVGGTSVSATEENRKLPGGYEPYQARLCHYGSPTCYHHTPTRPRPSPRFLRLQHLHVILRLAAQRSATRALPTSTSPCAVHEHQERRLRVRKQSSGLEARTLQGAGGEPAMRCTTKAAPQGAARQSSRAPSTNADFRTPQRQNGAVP